jgi:hypothetical protein
MGLSDWLNSFGGCFYSGLRCLSYADTELECSFEDHSSFTERKEPSATSVTLPRHRCPSLSAAVPKEEALTPTYLMLIWNSGMDASNSMAQMKAGAFVSQSLNPPHPPRCFTQSVREEAIQRCLSTKQAMNMLAFLSLGQLVPF